MEPTPPKRVRGPRVSMIVGLAWLLFSASAIWVGVGLFQNTSAIKLSLYLLAAGIAAAIIGSVQIYAVLKHRRK